MTFCIGLTLVTVKTTNQRKFAYLLPFLISDTNASSSSSKLSLVMRAAGRECDSDQGFTNMQTFIHNH